MQTAKINDQLLTVATHVNLWVRCWVHLCFEGRTCGPVDHAMRSPCHPHVHHHGHQLHHIHKGFNHICVCFGFMSDDVLSIGVGSSLRGSVLEGSRSDVSTFMRLGIGLNWSSFSFAFLSLDNLDELRRVCVGRAEQVDKWQTEERQALGSSYCILTWDGRRGEHERWLNSTLGCCVLFGFPTVGFWHQMRDRVSEILLDWFRLDE